MELHSQVVIKSDDAELRVDMARGLTGDTPTWVAEMMLVDTTGPVHVGVGFRGLDSSHLRTIAASLLSAAENLEALQDQLAVRTRAAEAPTAKPLTENGEKPERVPKVGRVDACATAISYLLARAECNTDGIENWPGTMLLAGAVVDAVENKLAEGGTTYEASPYEALGATAIAALQRVFNSRECAPSDHPKWPGIVEVAKEALKPWWHVFEHPPIEAEESTVPVKPAEAPTAKPAPKKPVVTYHVSAGPTMTEAVARELNHILARTAYDWREVQGWPGNYHMALTLLDTAARAVADGLTRGGIKARMRTALKLVLEKAAPEYNEVDNWPGEHVLVNGVIDLILNKEK